MGQLTNRIPLWLKLAYSAFMAILISVYLAYYGPTNFLYVCDFALVLTLIGIWTESPLLISMCMVGIGVLQALWVVDFIFNLLGISVTGVTDYMFESQRSVFLRGLSLFHGWLPFLLAYLIWKIGYDRRALFAWTIAAGVLLLTCFFLMPPPQPEPGLMPVNINYVWGPSDHFPQTWVSAAAWLIGLIVGLPIVVYAPTHVALMRLAPRRRLVSQQR